MPKIDTPTLEYLVQGINLQPGTLHEQFNAQSPTLLVFLRHFGCVFCRETVADLRRLTTENPNFPDVLFVFQATIEEGRTFFENAWPSARAIADPPQTLYDAFGLQRGGIIEMFGPETWPGTVRAISKGHFLRTPQGDPWMMPGLFLIQDNIILWQHIYKHAGDHPYWPDVLRLTADLTRE